MKVSSNVKISSLKHKVYLFERFHEFVPMRGNMQRVFSFDVVPHACSTLSKLKIGAKEEIVKGQTQVTFTDVEVVFNFEECGFIKSHLLDSVAAVSPDNHDKHVELVNIFTPKEEEEEEEDKPAEEPKKK